MSTYVLAMLWFEKLRERREALGLSQSDLAKKVSVSQAGINKIENGRVLRTKFLPRIAKELGLNLAELDPDYSDFRTKTDIVSDNYGSDGIYEYGLYYATDDKIEVQKGDTNLLLTEDRTDGTILIYEKPFGKIDRPPFLRSQDNLVALLLQTDRMFPEFSKGDIVFGLIKGEPFAGSTCIFVSSKYGLPEANVARICRVTEVFDSSWNTMQWKSNKNDVRTEILFENEWAFSVLIVAKYYARYDAVLSDYIAVHPEG